ncbi:permease [Ideonella sp. B7]|uniref:esterase/lipase family protein n=1 Tax=Ideonella benzenivorans TaxID=2831643 RepID=UPI001CED86AE|nr:alpha/beta fold hydrolase [Ideonella benzenivorans]MCA6216562.1 permease [Ideonella benzenivorans]
MIARWQRWAVLLGLAGLLAGVGGLWQTGHPALAGGLLVLALVMHAFWLGVTTLLMRAVQARAGQPLPPWRESVRAWWAECRAAPRVFAWRQPFRSQAQPDVWPAEVPGRPGVLLVHGYLCNRAVWNPWLQRCRQLGIPALALTLEPPGVDLDRHVPALAAAVQTLWERTGQPPLLVGHSMGGLLLRAWLRADAGRTPCRGLVTVGTPHLGTWLAHWGLSPSARQMRPGSNWLRALAADEAARASGLPPVLSLYSPCDSIVFPTRLAVWPGGEALAVAQAGHVNLLEQPAVFEAVRQRLQQGGAAEGGDV